MMPMTVNDRMKRNGGFVAGPRHVLAGMSGEAGTPDADEKSEGNSTAPNYRESDDTQQDCASCQHLSPEDGLCMKYNFTPKLYYVCDSFEPLGGSPEKSGEANEGDTENYPA